MTDPASSCSGWSESNYMQISFLIVFPNDCLIIFSSYEFFELFLAFLLYFRIESPDILVAGFVEEWGSIFCPLVANDIVVAGFWPTTPRSHPWDNSRMWRCSVCVWLGRVPVRAIGLPIPCCVNPIQNWWNWVSGSDRRSWTMVCPVCNDDWFTPY